MAWIFFLKFWIVFDFLQKPSAWFSNFYLRVQSKNCGRNIFFYSSFLNFSGFWAKSFSDFWPKNVKNLSKLPSTSPEEQFVAWIFFKFWIFSDSLKWPLAWFSKFYLRIQSKNCGKNSFFCVFLFRTFFEFWAIYFQIFGQNTSKVFKTIFCVFRGTICAFKNFLKVLNRYGFSAETFGMVLKFLSTCPE